MSAPTGGGARSSGHATPPRAEARHPEMPEVAATPAHRSDALQRAQIKAPRLTAEFVARYRLDDDYLSDVADGLIPAPPYVADGGDNELHLTPGGWVITRRGALHEPGNGSTDPRFPEGA